MNNGMTLALGYILIVITVFIPIVAATSSDDQAIVNKIKAHESHLRALVVILSLAGGLALSFGLGAGICLYWHLREFRRKKHLTEPVRAVVDIDSPIIIVTPSSATDHPPLRVFPPPLPQIVPLMVDTRTTNEGAPQPGPSAPSAKEILHQQEEVAVAAVASASSPASSSSDHQHQQQQHQQQQQNHCCHLPPIPPPAYTPRTLNNLIHEPDIAPVWVNSSATAPLSPP